MKTKENSQSNALGAVNSQTVCFVVFALTLLLQTQGYCDEVEEINKLTTGVMNAVFSPWVRRIALVFSGGAGLVQMFASGSIKPLLLWGGLGVAVNYMPRIIELIIKM